MADPDAQAANVGNGGAPAVAAVARPVARLNAARMKQYEDYITKLSDEGSIIDQVPLGHTMPGFPSHAPWEKRCLQVARMAADVKMFKKMNGMRVIMWRVCIEKRRKYLADMIFGGPVSSLPDDCSNKIAEFLPVCTAAYVAECWVDAIVKNTRIVKSVANRGPAAAIWDGEDTLDRLKVMPAPNCHFLGKHLLTRREGGTGDVHGCLCRGCWKC